MTLTNRIAIVDQFQLKMRTSGIFMWLFSKIFLLVECFGVLVAFRKEKEQKVISVVENSHT